MISMHEKVKARRVTAVRIASSGGVGVRSTLSIHEKNNFVDPWLTERVLYKQLRLMISYENEFQKNMVAMIKEMENFDESVVVGIRNAVVDFLSARENQMDGIKSLGNSAKQLLSTIDPHMPFSNYASNHNLLSAEIWTAPRVLQDFPYDMHEIRIAKQGVMGRPYYWSRTGWAPALYVITESGYLHCFKKVHGQARGDESRKNRISKSSNGGWFLGGIQQHAIVPPSAETLAAEGMELPVYENLDAPATLFSICLSNSGRVKVDTVSEKSSLFVFSVNVYKTVRDVVPLKRHEVKASNESEMIEWVACLKEAIEKYLPQGPPGPLFSPQEEILERVDSVLTGKMRQAPPPPPSQFKKIQSEKSDLIDTTKIEYKAADSNKIDYKFDALKFRHSEHADWTENRGNFRKCSKKPILRKEPEKIEPNL
ncbi:hypothetical protein HK100_003123 [Physocladia obscura]|uniref:PH domain-containing protein n=1 Tax=Physocladia obscura TaxID=109957 RepID=A0AAD5T9M7_9FUNG|nr:hypothetical protein HK100_003123 [Physocladia obscura]